jgi:hypothetical protein
MKWAKLHIHSISKTSVFLGWFSYMNFEKKMFIKKHNMKKIMVVEGKKLDFKSPT